MNKIIFGDCRRTMRELIAQGVKVQMCVTSPPYFGLRSYGIGAENGEIGLEQTPDEYVANMVEVFSLVWDLLADDGVIWVNLGSSYAGSTMTGGNSGFNASGGENGFKQKRQFSRAASHETCPTQSLLRQRVHACGTNGKEPQDFQVADRACHDSCDEPQGEILTRHADNAHSDLSAEQDALLPSQINRDSGHQDYVKEPLSALPDDDLASTMQQSSVQHQDAFYRPATASVSQKEVWITKHCAQESEHSSACTAGTAQMLQPLEVHTMGKESFFSACRRSSCKGIGKCGYCFASLSIASLNVKSKDELNIPHLVAMAIQADGWYLRQTIIWSKPNPMPESVTDRCTKAHEYLFLLSKSERYYFDNEAIKEPAVCDRTRGPALHRDAVSTNGNGGLSRRDPQETRNRRSVWTIATTPYSGAHFATFPPALIEPCILAGSRVGDVVLDPFMGSGTTAQVAIKLGRQYLGCELNPAYADLQNDRTAQDAFIF